MTVVYVASASSTGSGRDGHVETDDGKISVDLAFPKALGGTGAGSNPEQLVAMGYAACFASALGVVARGQKIALAEPVVTCQVSLHKDDDGFSLSFEIVADLPDLPRPQAERLVAEAHAICPYSKAFAQGAPAQVRAGLRA